jgi:serine/threonine protein kinase
LIDAAGHPHLTDFGLAVPADRGPSSSLTDSGSVVGTPGYMSPEQARGETNLDRKTDVYSLGVMLFEILAGRVPFVGPSAVDVMVRIVTDPIPPPSTLARAAVDTPNPAELERICLRAACKDPAGRYATALEFADEISRWLRGEVAASPAPVLRPRPHRRRRR